MAKYILLSFEDDDDAGLFVDVYSELDYGFEIEGVFKKPTKFCECTSADRIDGFTRGSKYGWWLHAKCAKPKRAWAERDHQNHFGKNLLNVKDRLPEEVT